MITVVYLVQILICVCLILLVTTSEKEEGGLGSAVGGGSGRGRFKPGYEERMDKMTQSLAIAFFVFSLIIARFTG